MGKNTSYTCDRCKHTQESTQGFGEESPNPWYMYTVHLVVHQGEQTLLGTGARYVDNRDWSSCVMWCGKCLAEVGIRTPTAYHTAVVEPPKQLEDVIFEMISTVLDERGIGNG